MRLTPAQIAMYGLLGEWLPMGMPDDQSLADRIRDGREFLVELAGLDLGYDATAWHEHLCATDDGGYCWSNKHLEFPKRISAAMSNPEWKAAIDFLSK